MKIKHFVIFITFCFLISCKENQYQGIKIQSKQIAVDSSTVSNIKIDSFIAPFKDHLNKQLDSVLCFTTGDLTKIDGDLESSLGNLMADICLVQSNPIFNKRTQKNIDFVLLNHGGIRAPIAKGNISSRNAFQVMPFENELVVVELTTSKIKELLEYLANAKKAHPIANMTLAIHKEGNAYQNVMINSTAFESDSEEKTYHVLTSDYLQQGGDQMNFFNNPVALHKLDYKLRNAMIDYFKKTDTITPKLDQRFTYAN